jgi:hypothetical protein
MSDFQRCIDLILAEEGGLANHRRDPGGLTNYGISQRAYPDLNLAALTRETAIAICQPGDGHVDSIARSRTTIRYHSNYGEPHTEIS